MGSGYIVEDGKRMGAQVAGQNVEANTFPRAFPHCPPTSDGQNLKTPTSTNVTTFYIPSVPCQPTFQSGMSPPSAESVPGALGSPMAPLAVPIMMAPLAPHGATAINAISGAQIAVAHAQSSVSPPPLPQLLPVSCHPAIYASIATPSRNSRVVVRHGSNGNKNCRKDLD